MFEPEAEGSCVSLRGGPQLLELPRRSGRLGADAGNGECSTGGVQPTRGNVPPKTHRRVEKIGEFATDGHHSTVCHAIRRIEASRDGRRCGQTVEGLSRGNSNQVRQVIRLGEFVLFGQPAAVQLVRTMAITEDLVNAGRPPGQPPEIHKASTGRSWSCR